MSGGGRPRLYWRLWIDVAYRAVIWFPYWLEDTRLGHRVYFWLLPFAGEAVFYEQFPNGLPDEPSTPAAGR